LDAQDLLGTSLEISHLDLANHQASSLTADRKYPILSEEWSHYATLRMQLSTSIPLQRMTLSYLERMKIGTTLCSNWAAFEDVPLYVNDIFLANVCFEPAGRILAARISDFVPRSPPANVRNTSTLQRASEMRKHENVLDALPVRTFLRFGISNVALEDITQLAAGHVIMLNRPVDAPVEVVARSYVVASGTLVLVGGYYAVQITNTAHLLTELPVC
jgi:flagellar motor switch/type III secretory pathway protein FliN